MTLTVPPELAVAEAYGFPGDTPELDVATVFLSRRKGGLLVEVMPTGDHFPVGATVSGELSYTTMQGETMKQSIHWTLPGMEGDDCWYEQPSVGRAVALAVLVDGMKNAAEVYGEDAEAAVELMELVCARISADIDELQDDALIPEWDLAEAIRQLMIDGAEQGDMYLGN